MIQAWRPRPSTEEEGKGVQPGTESSLDFQEYLRRRRVEVDAALDALLPRPPACPALLAEAMRYSVEAGGKRLRPILALASAESIATRPGALANPGRAPSAGEARRRAMPAACAVELIHTYSLIHDDLPAMDDDTLRRGRPTLHVVYGEGIAILAGDGLLTEAFAVLASLAGRAAEPAGAARLVRAIGRIAEAAGSVGMVGGQAIDLECAGSTRIPNRERPLLDRAGLQAMHARKTGALIRAAAVSGAVLAGGTETEIDAVDRFAAEIGLVFQIVDDILDVEGASDLLGKTAGKDAAAGKPTYPALFGLETSRTLAAEGIARASHALDEAGLGGSRLLDIAQWVVARSH
jgi:geranylgeranyl diphosphate synthase, type II